VATRPGVTPPARNREKKLIDEIGHYA